MQAAIERNDWGSERRSIDILVMLTESHAFTQFDRNQLAQQRKPEGRGLVEVCYPLLQTLNDTA